MSEQRQRRPTIRDVAAAAGVSTATVSHALNDKGRVDPATRKRVFDVASELGYRPSRIGRALRTQRTGSLAFLVPPFESGPTQAQMLGLDLYMRQAFSAASAAFAAEHALLLIPPLEGDPGEAEALGVDGAIICDPSLTDPQVQSFEAAGLPVVTLEHRPDRPGDPWSVAADNGASLTELLDHLADQGARSIVLMTLEANIAWDAENRSAFRDWCARNDREPRIAVASPHALETSAYSVAGGLLDGKDPPDAIIASSQGFPTGTLRAVKDRGLRVPEDVMVAGAIDGLETQAASPPLTAIDVDPDLQGRLAAEMLIARLAGEDPDGPVTTPHSLRIRASTQRRA